MQKLKRIKKWNFSSSSSSSSLNRAICSIMINRTVSRLRSIGCDSNPKCVFGIAIGLFVISVKCFNVSAENIYESTTPLTTARIDTVSLNVSQIEGYTNYSHHQSTTPATSPSPSSNLLRNRTYSGKSFFSTLSTNNELWDGIIHDCYQKPSFSCFQKNVYTFLNDALETKDLNVTQRLKFYKNQVDYEAAKKLDESTNTNGNDDDDDHDDDHHQHLNKNEIPNESRAAISPIEEVTNSLYDKSAKFVMTHDVELHLPEILFDGATFRISPRSIEGNGAIVKLELIPKAEIEARSTGKIFKKKFQKFIRSKLLLSFLAILLVIKIIKIKIFWLLPIIIGVGAAKKLLLKFLLFLFPALSHLFKLCSYYQQTYHSTKYHHHHHLINHHHTIVPTWHGDHGSHGPGPELIYTNPPKGHISTYLHGAPVHETYGQPSNLHEHYPNDWENSGPGLGSDYIGDIHRNAQVDGDYFKPNMNDASVLHSWGLGTTQTTPIQSQQQQQQLQQHHILQQLQQQMKQQQLLKLQQQQQQQQQHFKQQSSSHNSNANTFLYPEQQSRLATKLKSQGAEFLHSQPNAPLADVSPDAALSASEIAAQYDPARNKILQQLSPEIAAQLKEALRIETEKKIIEQQQKILEKQPFVQSEEKIMPKNYDPFYSPILMKVDKVIEQLGVTDEYCKERIVCSMYKDPRRYSPHSNFVSAELSRDSSELQPVQNANPAVLRFYRLVQAARDGQEKRNCIQLYPQCSINTE